jgi:hypothetical protein
MPDRKKIVSRVPLTPMAGGARTTYFQTLDVADLAAEVGLQLVVNDIEAIATRLDEAAAYYFLFSRVDAHATAGELAKWARDVEKRAAALLELFDLAESMGTVSAHAVAAFLREMPRAGDGLLTVLQMRMRNRGKTPDDAAAIGMALDGVRLLRRHAALAASSYGAKKKPPREAAGPEMVLFRKLADIYRDAFGREPTYTTGTATNRSGEVWGPGLSFCRAVLTRMQDRHRQEPTESERERERDADCLQRIRYLCGNDQALVGRLREGRRGGKPRRR